MQLTFLIVGLGSMGKRRIRNLRANGEEKIIGFDIRIDRLKEAETKYNIQTIDDFKTLSPDDFDGVIDKSEFLSLVMLVIGKMLENEEEL